MLQDRLAIRMSKQEKRALKSQAQCLGFTLTEYVRRKLFDENDDLVDDEGKFISPHIEKHNVVSVTILHKIVYLVMAILKNRENVELDTIIAAEKQALEYARKERKKYGYKHIKPMSKGNE